MSAASPRDREAALRRARRTRERLLRDGEVVSRADGAARRLAPLAVSPAEGEALRGWVLRERAARTIEIGLGYGISALFVCEGLLANGDPVARHVVVDPYQMRLGNCGLQVVEEAGLAPLVQHHAEESQLALPRMLGEGRRFDLAFVDGNHRFDAVFLDLVYLGRLLRPGAVVFLDDYQLPAVARAASFFLRNLGWTLEEVSPADALHQWAVLRTSRTADERPFDFYVEF
jgi:predicted O-methyltransferase YrrM